MPLNRIAVGPNPRPIRGRARTRRRKGIELSVLCFGVRIFCVLGRGRSRKPLALNWFSYEFSGFNFVQGIAFEQVDCALVN